MWVTRDQFSIFFTIHSTFTMLFAVNSANIM